MLFGLSDVSFLFSNKSLWPVFKILHTGYLLFTSYMTPEGNWLYNVFKKVLGTEAYSWIKT